MHQHLHTLNATQHMADLARAAEERRAHPLPAEPTAPKPPRERRAFLGLRLARPAV
jgi:hypothetical protein